MNRILETLTAEGKAGEMFRKMMALLLIVLISLIFLNVFLNDRDGRNSVVSIENSNYYADENKTGDELRLENILECMSDVGNAEVMIKGNTNSGDGLFEDGSRDSSENVEGVIVVAEGASNAVVKSEIVDAVSTVCGISPHKVIVFEMSGSSTEESAS